MNDLDIICECNNVSVKDMKEQMKNGITTFEQLQEVTKIGLYCPPCADKSRTIFARLKEDKNL